MSQTVNPVAFDSPKGFEYTQKTEVVRGTVPVLAGTYDPGGFPVNWAIDDVVTTTASPFEVEVWSASGSGYVYVYNTATSKLQVFESGASGFPLGELLQAAIPNGIVNDVIQFKAVFSKFSFFTS